MPIYCQSTKHREGSLENRRRRPQQIQDPMTVLWLANDFSSNDKSPGENMQSCTGMTSSPPSSVRFCRRTANTTVLLLRTPTYHHEYPDLSTFATTRSLCSHGRTRQNDGPVRQRCHWKTVWCHRRICWSVHHTWLE